MQGGAFLDIGCKSLCKSSQQEGSRQIEPVASTTAAPSCAGSAGRGGGRGVDSACAEQQRTVARFRVLLLRVLVSVRVVAHARLAVWVSLAPGLHGYVVYLVDAAILAFTHRRGGRFDLLGAKRCRLCWALLRQDVALHRRDLCRGGFGFRRPTFHTPAVGHGGEPHALVLTAVRHDTQMLPPPNDREVVEITVVVVVADVSALGFVVMGVARRRLAYVIDALLCIRAPGTGDGFDVMSSVGLGVAR